MGDGVVSLASLEIPGTPPPVLFRASHRGLLARLLPGEPEPAAIPYVIAVPEEWTHRCP